MRTARTTVLLTDAERAELDAFAASRGESVSNVVRDATVRYMAQPRDESAEESELAALVEQVNAAIPRMQASLVRTCEKMEAFHAEMDAFFKEKGIQ
jgi:metal-responsive CopG/Arc/MetJ family transcriptional regulator